MPIYLYIKYKLYRGQTRTYFLKMTLMTNDLNDHFAKTVPWFGGYPCATS